jgi:iron complex outermembrane receptor protein
MNRIHRSARRRAGWLLLLILFSGNVFGNAADPAVDANTAEADPAQEAFPLPLIAVKAKRIEAPRSLITREATTEDFRAWNALTAGDALTYVPGVNVQIGGSSGDARAWIRGFRDRDVLVLYDGIPIASGFEGTIDLNEISLQSAAGIRVLKSAPSVIYGTNGLGGVIDVMPRTSLPSTYLDGSAELGSDGRRLLQATAGTGNGNLSFLIAGSRQQADDFSLSDDYTPELNQPPGHRVNSDYERNNLFLQFGAMQSVLGRTNLFINISDAEKGLPVESGVEDPDYQRLTHSRRQTVGLSNQFDRIPLSLKLYYNSYDSELTTYNDDRFDTVDEVEKAEDYSWGGKLYSTLETSERNTLVLTGSAQKDVFEAEGELEDGNKAELMTYTLAAEDQFWLTDKLSLAAGLIYVHFDQTRLNKTNSALNPQVALAYQLNEHWAVHGSAAQRTRFPKLRELYRRRYGNPDLKEQTANNYEFGMTYQYASGLSWDFSVFQSDVDDLIERLSRRDLYQNLDRVTFKGLETAGGGWVNEKLFLRLAYTWVDAEEEVEGGSARQLRSRPKHTAMGEFRYRFPHDFLFSFNGIYVSDLYDLDPDGVYTELPSYFVANVRLAKSFTPRLEAYLAVSNLLDQDYEHRIGNPREGRAFMLGVDFGYH